MEKNVPKNQAIQSLRELCNEAYEYAKLHDINLLIYHSDEEPGYYSDYVMCSPSMGSEFTWCGFKKLPLKSRKKFAEMAAQNVGGKKKRSGQNTITIHIKSS